MFIPLPDEATRQAILEKNLMGVAYKILLKDMAEIVAYVSTSDPLFDAFSIIQLNPYAAPPRATLRAI